MEKSDRKIIGKVYPSSSFSYNKELKRFESTLTRTPAILRQLWNDSYELGFGIRSVKTNRIVFFTLASATGEPGCYTDWTFDVSNVDSDERLIGLTAIIYNDRLTNESDNL